MDNRVYLPSVVTVNKADLIEPDYKETVDAQLREHDIDPDEGDLHQRRGRKRASTRLGDVIWEELGLIRIYMDKPNGGVDYEEPLILRAGQTIEDACEKLGGDF